MNQKWEPERILSNQYQHAQSQSLRSHKIDDWCERKNARNAEVQRSRSEAIKITSASSTPLRLSSYRAEKSNAEKCKKIEGTRLQKVANDDVRIACG